MSVDVEGFLLKMMCREIVMGDSAWNVVGVGGDYRDIVMFVGE